MKQSELKKLIKESMREAIQEELKDLLLEAIRSNKQPVNESYNPESRTLNFDSTSIPPTANVKQKYMDMLNGMGQSQNTPEGEFKINGPVDIINGSLPPGQLSLDQIMKLTK
jgi:hypothetical protein